MYTPGLDIEYLQGIHIRDSVLWLDVSRKTDLCFVSHAHINQILFYKKILATDSTARLCAYKIDKAKKLICPFRQCFALGEFELELFPAGHILGSAQLRIRRGGHSLVYTGHFNLASTRTVEQAEILECDVLVMCARYGLARYCFPPREETESAIVDWVHSVLEKHENPVLLCGALGNAQELSSLFYENGLTTQLHRSIYNIAKIYRSCGVRQNKVKVFRGKAKQDQVILFPLRLAFSKAIRKLPHARFALVSGQAMDPRVAKRMGVERGFVLSAHADHTSLVQYARFCGAQKIYLVQDEKDALATELRKTGLSAWSLHPPYQLDLFDISNNKP